VYSGRDEYKVDVIEAYLKAVNLYRDYSDASQDPQYSEVICLCLITRLGSLIGRKLWY